MSARLALETSAARLVGRLSRATGRGGGTTLPGKLVWKLDPTALDALAARLSALAAAPALRERLGDAAHRKVSDYTPERWAEGMSRALAAVGASVA